MPLKPLRWISVCGKNLEVIAKNLYFQIHMAIAMILKFKLNTLQRFRCEKIPKHQLMVPLYLIV